MARNVTYTLVMADGGSSVTAYFKDDPYRPYVADESHPAFEQIVDGLNNDDPATVELFDVALKVAKRFLTDRVTYANGYLFFDNDPIDDSLAKHIVRTVQANEAYEPLVALYENIQENPSEHSRTQLYDFLRADDFTITRDGKIVGYKGVAVTDDGYESLYGGYAIVNGVPHAGGPVPQKIGDVVEMPRAKVAHDPTQACSVGLHVATFDFAKGYGHTVLEVEVHPRDVVSVPSDHSAQKVRVCRYKIVGEVTEPYSEPIKPEPKTEVFDGEDVPMAGTVTPLKHPSWQKFTTLRAKAKTQKKGLRKLAEKEGWTLIEGDGSQRQHWTTGQAA